MDGRFWIHMSVQLNVLGKVTEQGFREEKKKESTPSSRIRTSDLRITT